MKLKLLASVAAAGLFAAGAASAEPNGWYGAIDAGYHMIDDINAESSTTGANWNYEVNNGWAAFARLGYRFNPNWRVELEGGYRSGDIGQGPRRFRHARPVQPDPGDGRLLLAGRRHRVRHPDGQRHL